MSDTPEQLWARAHEHVRRGDFATAVRDLAACFQLLQASNDPRVYEVHKRWTEVHKMYLEDGARQEAPPAQKAPSVEAEAEAAANAGDLDRAIALYQKASAQQPQNELVRERLNELTNAKRRATELTTGTAPRTSPPSTAAQPTLVPTATRPDPAAERAAAERAAAERLAAERAAAERLAAERAAAERAARLAAERAAAERAAAERAAEWAAAVAAEHGAAVTARKSDDDWSEVSMDEGEAPAPRSAAPAMAVEDAPVGMQSLDVPFSVGDTIDAFQADDLPVAGGATTPPTSSSTTSSAASSPRASDVAFLEELLARVHANRRSPAARSTAA